MNQKNWINLILMPLKDIQYPFLTWWFGWQSSWPIFAFRLGIGNIRCFSNRNYNSYVRNRNIQLFFSHYISRFLSASTSLLFLDAWYGNYRFMYYGLKLSIFMSKILISFTFIFYRVSLSFFSHPRNVWVLWIHYIFRRYFGLKPTNIFTLKR